MFYMAEYNYIMQINTLYNTENHVTLCLTVHNLNCKNYNLSNVKKSTYIIKTIDLK